jgi:hypothetical protein
MEYKVYDMFSSKGFLMEYKIYIASQDRILIIYFLVQNPEH